MILGHILLSCNLITIKTFLCMSLLATFQIVTNLATMFVFHCQIFAVICIVPSGFVEYYMALLQKEYHLVLTVSVCCNDLKRNDIFARFAMKYMRENLLQVILNSI